MKLPRITLIGCIGLVAATLSTWHAHGNDAEAGPYFHVEAGPTLFEDGDLKNFGSISGRDVDYSVGGSLDAAIGYAFNRHLATDFEFGFMGTEIDSVPGFYSQNTFVYQAPLLVNLTLSLPTPDNRFVPFIGAGAGGSVASFDTDRFGNGVVTVYGSDEDVVFAWQAFAGVRFAINNQMSLGLRYRYFTADAPTFSYRSFSSGPDFQFGFDETHTHSIQFIFEMKF